MEKVQSSEEIFSPEIGIQALRSHNKSLYVPPRIDSEYFQAEISSQFPAVVKPGKILLIILHFPFITFYYYIK